MKMSTRFLLAATLLGACGGDDPCDPDAPGSICTIAGNGEQGFDGDEGPATAATLYVPQDMAVHPDGNLWLLDFNNYLVREIDPSGTIRTVIGSGELADSPPVGVAEMPAREAGFNHTPDMLFHDGYLYMAAWHNSRVKRVNLSTMMLENYAGAGKRTYYYGDGGPRLDAALDLPSSIALDPDGNIVIMDQANQVIRRVNAAGIIDRIAGKCVVDLDVPCTAGQQPTQCPGSNKFVCGDLATECEKTCTPGDSGDGGPALELRMGQPFGQSADPAGRIAYDTQGNLIFADTDNSRIRKVDTNGIVTTIAGTGVGGYNGDNKPAVEAQVNRPVDVEAGPDGSIYFTDVYNSCVRKIDTSGIISAVAGTCSASPKDRGFSGDGGPPLAAKLDRPYGIELVGKKLYVADTFNNRIRVVNLP
jgi:hypothetical protein